MRLLPYSKKLLERRAAGERPWLVIVTMGSEVERKLLRMAAFSGDAGVARLWVPDDFDIAQADLRWVVGLDVFIAGFEQGDRLGELAVAIWRAKPATLWFLDGTDEQDARGQWYTNMAKFTGTQGSYPRRWPSGRIEFEATHRCRLPLDASFRARVEGARDMALIVSEAPLFDSPAFDAARKQRMRELGAAA